MLNILLPIVTFLFIFGWKITDALDIIFVISLIITFISLVLFKETYSKTIIMMLMGLFISCIYSLMIVVVNGSDDIQIASRSIRTLINFMGAVSLIHIYRVKYKQLFIKKMLIHVCIAICGHGMLIYLMYINDEIRGLVYAIASTYNYVNLNAPFLLGYRIPGLTYGLSQTSVVQMFGLIILLAVSRYFRSGISRILIASGTLILIISLYLTGRTGLLFSIIFVPCIWLVFQKIGNEKITFRVFNYILLGCFILIILVNINAVLEFLPEDFAYNIKQSDEVLQVILGGEASTVEVVKDMYIFPESIITALFGSGNLGRGEFEYIESDIGYIRGIYAVGVIGTVIMLQPILYAFVRAIKVYSVDPYLSIVTCSTILSSLLLHAKELALYTRNQWSIEALLIAGCIYLCDYKDGNSSNTQSK